jgi:hypothetical protein
MPGIGLLNEKPLHAAVKQWCAQPGDAIEAVVGGYVIDLVRGDLLLEIQTRNFAAIRPKLTALVQTHRVRLVHPIARDKWIVRRVATAGGSVSRRKSPTTGRVEQLFDELVSVAPLLPHANLSLEVLMTREDELRRYEGRRRWRTRGWVVEERRLLDVAERRVFETPSDWRALLPPALDEFTTGDLAEAIGIGEDLARKMAYCLRATGAIGLIGKRGRANLYTAAV